MIKEQMVEPAVKGAQYVIRAAAEAKVRRVVLTSSIGAVYMDPHRDPEKVVDETCWSDLDFCKATKVCVLYIFKVVYSGFGKKKKVVYSKTTHP